MHILHRSLFVDSSSARVNAEKAAARAKITARPFLGTRHGGTVSIIHFDGRIFFHSMLALANTAVTLSVKSDIPEEWQDRAVLLGKEWNCARWICKQSDLPKYHSSKYWHNYGGENLGGKDQAEKRSDLFGSIKSCSLVNRVQPHPQDNAHAKVG